MSTNDTLRPQFWVLRPGTNIVVPLIAIDELPPTITIRGVPRSLEAKDLIGMTSAGSAESRHRTYIVDMPNEPAISRTPPTTNGLSCNDSIFANPSYGGTRATSNPNMSPPPPKAYGIAEQMPSYIKSPITGNQVSVTSFTTGSTFTAPLRFDRNPGPNPLPPWQDATSVPMKAAPGVKTYCSYWLRHGECDYAQPGCLYKHEMPLDRELLEELGFRDIPKWYRDKHGLGSFLAGGNGISGEKNERMERSWRNAREAEDRERDSASSGYAGGMSDGRVKTRGERVGGSTSVPKTMDNRSKLWKDDSEKKGDGRFSPRSSEKVAGSPLSSPASIKTSPLVTSRGPASRTPPSSTTTATTSTNGHYQSVLAKKTDEADRYAKDREMEELKRLKNHEILQQKRRGKLVTPETSSADESADFEYGGKGEESEWVEGDVDVQSAAISKDLKAIRLSMQKK